MRLGIDSAWTTIAPFGHSAIDSTAAIKRFAGLTFSFLARSAGKVLLVAVIASAISLSGFSQTPQPCANGRPLTMDQVLASARQNDVPDIDPTNDPAFKGRAVQFQTLYQWDKSEQRALCVRTYQPATDGAAAK